jgi:serine/threonine-protein kinase RsbW
MCGGRQALLHGGGIWHNRSIPNEVEIALDGSVSELDRLAEEVGAFCRAHALDEDAEFDLNLVLEELFTNSVRHGGCAGQSPAARIRLVHDGDGVGVEYRDRGVAFNPLDAPEANIHAPIEERRPGGMGIHLMRQIMTDLRYRRADGENELRMLRRKK